MAWTNFNPVVDHPHGDGVGSGEYLIKQNCLYHDYDVKIKNDGEKIRVLLSP